MEIKKDVSNLVEENKKALKNFTEGTIAITAVNESFEKFMNPPVGEVDNVNHPKHYEGKFECIIEMEKIFGRNEVITFCQCNAFKYLWRWAKKNGIEDVRKAQWYLNKAHSLCDLEPWLGNLNDALIIETQGAEAVFKHYVIEAFNALVDSDGDSYYLPFAKSHLDRALTIYDDFLV